MQLTLIKGIIYTAYTCLHIYTYMFPQKKGLKVFCRQQFYYLTALMRHATRFWEWKWHFEIPLNKFFIRLLCRSYCRYLMFYSMNWKTWFFYCFPDRKSNVFGTVICTWKEKIQTKISWDNFLCFFEKKINLMSETLMSLTLVAPVVLVNTLTFDKVENEFLP